MAISDLQCGFASSRPSPCLEVLLGFGSGFEEVGVGHALAEGLTELGTQEGVRGIARHLL